MTDSIGFTSSYKFDIKVDCFLRGPGQVTLANSTYAKVQLDPPKPFI
jgi:hypothetical protein